MYYKNKYSIILFPLIIVAFGICFVKSENKEQELWNGLKKDHWKYSRPVKQSEDQVKVIVKISLVDILNLCPKTQDFTALVQLNLIWNGNITWDEGQTGIKKLTIPLNELWSPEISILNSVSKRNIGNKDDIATIRPNGEVEVTQNLYLITKCTFDVTYFPFDQQTCILKIASEQYKANEVYLDLYNGEPHVWLDTYYPNIEWDIIEVPVYLNKYENQMDLTAYITIRRKTLKSTLEMIIPPILLGFLTTCTLLLSSNSREKIITNTIFISINLLLIIFWMNNLPSTSLVIPLLVKFVYKILGVQSTVFLFNIFTLNCTSRDGEMPGCLHIILNKILGKFCLCGYSKNYIPARATEIEVEESRNCYKMADSDNRWRNSGEVLSIIFFIVSILLLVTACLTLLNAPHIMETVTPIDIQVSVIPVNFD